MNYISGRALLLIIPITRRCLDDYVHRNFLRRYKDDEYSVDEIRRALRVTNLDEPFMLIKDVAEKLGLKRDRVVYLCTKNELKFYKFSFYGQMTFHKTTFYFRQSDLDHYIKVKSEIDALKEKLKKPEPAILYTTENVKPAVEAIVKLDSPEDLDARRKFIKEQIWKK